MKHLVLFSTGVASAEVAWRVVAEHGTENVTLLTADTLVEDEDNWRFGREVAEALGCEWVRLADGRTPMQVGRDRKCVPSNQRAVCSQILKRNLLDKYRAEHFDPADTIVYLGYDWTEPHRVEAAQGHWAPWTMDCPLTRPPYLWKQQLLDLFRERGIEPPRLYGYGFQHANCLHPDTRFITDEGVRTLRECLGKQVRVLGRGGGWHDAEIHTFGRQELWEIRMRRYGDERVVLSTLDHLWPIRKAAGRTDYLFRPTSALIRGQRIASMYGQDWQIVSALPTGRREEVMCAVVPDGHVFTLDGGLLTHNCGGGCVRGGQAQWSLLLQVNRPRYLQWEADEEVSREQLGKDVSILRDRTKPKVVSEGTDCDCGPGLGRPDRRWGRPASAPRLPQVPQHREYLPARDRAQDPAAHLARIPRADRATAEPVRCRRRGRLRLRHDWGTA